MQQKPPLIDLEYRAVRDEYPRGDQAVAYMISVAMGASGVFVLGALIEIFSTSIRSGPDVIGRLFMCAIIGAVGTVVASNFFRIFSGSRRASPRLIVILGTINGLLGMGVFMACFVLDNHHLLRNAGFWRDGIVVINVALPILMGVIKTANQRPLGT